MLSTIPYTALLSHTPIFSSSSIAVLMFWPWPPMHVDAHTTLYTLHSNTLHCFAWPHSKLFEFFQWLFLCFDPRPQCTSRTDHTLYYTLYTLPPPTFTLQTPVLNLTPIFSSYSSSSIAFLLFWPPQCTSMHGPGGYRTPPSPNCHLVHWPQNRPRWPPQMVGELPQIGCGFGTLPPRPPILTSFAMSNFSQAWQLAFVIYIYIYVCVKIISFLYHPKDLMRINMYKSINGGMGWNGTFPRTNDRRLPGVDRGGNIYYLVGENRIRQPRLQFLALHNERIPIRIVIPDQLIGKYGVMHGCCLIWLIMVGKLLWASMYIHVFICFLSRDVYGWLIAYLTSGHQQSTYNCSQLRWKSNKLWVDLW